MRPTADFATPLSCSSIERAGHGQMTAVMLLTAAAVVGLGLTAPFNTRVVGAPVQDKTANSAFGQGLSCVGDVNGDGWSDAVVAARFASLPTKPQCGALLLISGKDGALLGRIDGPVSRASIGESLDAGADLDGDGVRDIVAGCRRLVSGEEPWALGDGGIMVFSGKTGKGMMVLGGRPSMPEKFDFVGGQCVASVEVRGGPGLGLIAICAWEANSNGNPGCLFIKAYPLGGRVPIWKEPVLGDGLVQLCSLPDLDNDGHGEVAICTCGESREGKDAPNEVRVVSGASGKTLWRQCGTCMRGEFGRAISAVGDIDGDSVPDIAIGETGAGESSPSVGSPPNGRNLPRTRGRVVLYSGRSGKVLWEVYGPTSGVMFGSCVSSICDVDHDRVPDVCVGAPGLIVEPADARTFGALYILSGKTGKSIQVLKGTVESAPIGRWILFLPAVGKDSTPQVLATAKGSPGVGIPDHAYLQAFTLDGAERFRVSEDSVLGLGKPK